MDAHEQSDTDLLRHLRDEHRMNAIMGVLTAVGAAALAGHAALDGPGWALVVGVVMAAWLAYTALGEAGAWRAAAADLRERDQHNAGGTA